MELCDKILSQLLTDKIIKDINGFNEEEIFEIISQLNNTCKIMKEVNIIHRDLKLENILIKYNDKGNINYTTKLTDYGSSKRLISFSRNYFNSNIGTLAYMSPELLKKENYNYKSDLWSIGIIIYRLFFRKAPFSGNTENDILNNIHQFGNNLKITGNDTLDDLIKKILVKYPVNRLDWDGYLNHPFFKKNKEIKLVYKKFGNDDVQTFGTKFVENNKNNIELIINSVKSELIDIIKNTGGALSARLRGVTLGARKGSHTERRISKITKEIIKRHSKSFGGALTDVECMKMAGCSKKTYYKIKKGLLGG